MNEQEGAALLRARFEAAGFRIREGYRYESEGFSFSIDGFDPDANVGYEYVTSEAGDRAEITSEILAHLEKRMRSGEIAVLLIDEYEAPSADLLTFAVDRFLEAIQTLRKKKKPAKKPAKRPVKKPGKRKAAKKKAAVKKKAAKK